MNYVIYRKWLKTLKRINCSEDDLGSLVSAKLITDHVPLIDQIANIGIGPNPSEFNCCHIIIKEDLFLFPKLSPFHKMHGRNGSFCTEYLSPIVISLSNSIHPYETKWKLDTFINIEKVVNDENQTRIYMKSRVNDAGILLKLDNRITINGKEH